MAACHSFQRALELDHKNVQAQQDIHEHEKRTETDFVKQDFRKVDFLHGLCPRVCPTCHCFKITKAGYLAQYLVITQRHAVRPAPFRLSPCSVGGSPPLPGRREGEGGGVFVQALKMAPAHKHACLACRDAQALKAEKEENKAFKEGNDKPAYELYAEALQTDTPPNIKINALL